jgi:hypothetical protein
LSYDYQVDGPAKVFLGAIDLGAISELGDLPDEEALDVLDFEASLGFERYLLHRISDGYPNI